MNTIVKYLAIGSLAFTALISGNNALYHPSATSHPEVIRGRVTQVEERTSGPDKFVTFGLEFITGEKRGCARLKQEERLYGDCYIIGSGNIRNTLLPSESIDICCPDGRNVGHCVLPGDSHYEGCLGEVQYYEKQLQK